MQVGQPAALQAQQDMNPVWLAQSRLRRRKFDECLEICTPILERNPYDQVRRDVKLRCRTLRDPSSTEQHCMDACYYSKARFRDVVLSQPQRAQWQSDSSMGCMQLHELRCLHTCMHACRRRCGT